jgi:hypothetical protein
MSELAKYEQRKERREKANRSVSGEKDYLKLDVSAITEQHKF